MATICGGALAAAEIKERGLGLANAGFLAPAWLKDPLSLLV